MAAAEPTLFARGVGRRFDAKWALAHVDLDVHAGEVLLLAGPNGAGKTTLLKILAGLERPTLGQARVLGVAPFGRPLPNAHRVGVVMHASYLYETLSAREHVMLASRMLGKGAEPPEAYLERVGLLVARDAHVGTFSAGMKKRLTVALVLLKNPDVVLLDEPFSSLDARGQDFIASWLGELRASGKTVVVASHAFDRAPNVATRAIVLHDGQIAWSGAPGDAEAALRTCA